MKMSSNALSKAKQLAWRLGAAAALVALFAATPARAQDDEEEAAETPVGRPEGQGSQQKSLAERIPSVTARAFQKGGRVELMPAIGLSLNDPFFQNITLGGGLTYHILESLSIGASGEYFLAPRAPVTVVGGGAQTEPDYNRPLWAARLDVTWAPFYGKFSFMAETILRFDLYLTLGAGVVGKKRDGTGFAGSVAIGQRFFLNEWLALKLELRDQLFTMRRQPTAGTEQALQGLLTGMLGVCFYLPTSFEREQASAPTSE